MSLKAGRPGSDTPIMFFSARSAPDPETTQLQALRVSLNKPVLAIDELPLGPARGVIAIVQGPAPGRRLVVAIRSTRTDQAIFFWSDPLSGEPRDSAGLLDAAVSFAETMGFLFDDDLEPAADASQLWADWVGKAASPPLAASPKGANDPAVIPLTKFRLGPGHASIGDRLDPLGTDAEEEENDGARSA